MCGVIGMRCEKDRGDLGAVAARLLRMLEYRGYDSTGAIIQAQDGRITLRKDVGSPTAVAKKLGIPKLSGRVFCGQVRWATFGAVTRANAQPHEVRCKTGLYGAHNGNITNCGPLKNWLVREGHQVAGDNDGEMLVHVVEHFFAKELRRAKNRRMALKTAVLNAAKILVGSYAAVVVDPQTQLVAAIKAGSSLYMGLGDDETHGAFIIASSDLAAVLSQTKILIPMAEDEFALYTHGRADFFHLRSGRPIAKKPVRSRLKITETELREPFRYFMQQEIFSQPDAVRKVISLFLRRSPAIASAEKLAGARPALARTVRKTILDLSAITHAERLHESFAAFAKSGTFAQLRRGAAADVLKSGGFESSLGSFIEELAALAPRGCAAALKLLDAVLLKDEADDIARRCDAIVSRILAAHRGGRHIALLACGTSYHAAKAAAVFFNRIAGIKVCAALPGDFRAESAAALRDGDLVIGISQSGETKDLIDVINLIRASRKKVAVVTVVNNVNSTLALEKTDLYLPLFCGPEIAVPATKSFMNQLAVLYVLALKAAQRMPGRQDAAKRLRNLLRVPELLEETLSSTKDAVEEAAHSLYLAPSMHILATGMQGVAKEGALKVREVVLNHTEGYEGAEFKHGPNTILGVNTIFGLAAVRAILGKFAGFSKELAGEKGLSAKSLARLYRAVTDYAFDDVKPGGLSEKEKLAFARVFDKHDLFASLYANYPLVFVTGPGERDVNLTISQIHTHVIRGADVYMIAEENPALREAAGQDQPERFDKKYESGYIRLPRTDDDLLPFFTSAAALQLLALHMSVKKLTLLDKLEILGHGVHPDSPKNVSKSITVD